MLSSNYPSYVQEILSGLSSSIISAESVLLRWAEYANRDVALFDIYTELGYSNEAHRFMQPPDARKAIELIRSSYGVEIFESAPLYSRSAVKLLDEGSRSL
jgi:hypothetical protein